ncbi:hypothetical protein [Bradyrhizobium frederickii]|uniref:hypothetical protein n=1 Tax=Bradyrhizobium frederickii TaxID=2560054 RepID=UPI001430FBAB|nr:hypothetical protein [Bradyrhizobium frederickii]
MALGSPIDTHFFHPTRWGQGVGFLKITARSERQAGSDDPAMDAQLGGDIDPPPDPGRK